MRILPAILLASLGPIASGAPIQPLGPEFVVTESVYYNEGYLWIAGDNQGDFVITYSIGDVFARRLDRDGMPLGGDFEVSPRLRPGTQNQGHVARDPKSGDFLVCYSDWNVADGSGMAAMGRFFRADGTPYGDAIPLTTKTLGSQFEPDAAFLPDGRVMVAWTDSTIDGAAGCQGRVFDRTGVAVSSDFPINLPSPETQIDPSIAASRVGTFVCAYVDASGAHGDPRDIMARLFDRDGAPLGDPILVNTIVDGMQRGAHVAMAANGDFVVVWQDEFDNDGSGFGVFARLFDADGQPKGPDFPVPSETVGDQRNPKVTTDFVGNFVVTFESNALGDWDQFVRHFDRFGTPLSDDQPVHTEPMGEQISGHSTLSQSGERLITVWHDQSGTGGGDAMGRLFSIPAVSLVESPTPYRAVTVGLEFPGMGGEAYHLLPSLETDATLEVNGERSLPLGADEWMQLAVSPTSDLYAQLQGTLDSAGKAEVTFTLPNDPALSLRPLRLVGVTLLEGGSIDPVALAAGSLEGVEFVTDPFRLDVDLPLRLFPGQPFGGELIAIGDEAELVFEAVAGEKIIWQTAPPPSGSPLAQFEMQISHHGGEPLKSFFGSIPQTEAESRKFKFKAPTSGSYSLRLVGQDGATGSYRFTTRHKLPKKAQAKSKKLRVTESSKPLRTKFLAVAGGKLNATIEPRGKTPPIERCTLIAPSGAEVAIDRYATQVDSIYRIDRLLLPETGLYRILITGAPKKYQLAIEPVPPTRTEPLSVPPKSP